MHNNGKNDLDLDHSLSHTLPDGESGFGILYDVEVNGLHACELASDQHINNTCHPKLLIASQVFGRSGQPWLWRQVVGLQGFQKNLLCWQRENPITQPVEDVSVHVLQEDPAPYDGANRWWYRLQNLPGQNYYAALGRERLKIEELLHCEQPNVILCYFGDIGMRLLPIARQAGIPVVVYLHGDFLFVTNRWYRWSLIRCLRQFAAIAVVTEAERRWLMEHGVPEEKVYIIPCGAPTDLFCPGTYKSSGTVRFVMSSRLVDEKGCDKSIEAFASLALEGIDVELHIYGDGPARIDLQRLVEDLGLKDKVFFYGYVEQQRLAEKLSSYDIFIQHSLRKEGSPVSIIEAMASGLPVVATSVGGINAQVMEEKTGVLVAENDVLGMVAAMRRLASDLELRRNLGRAGRERAVNMFDSSLQTRCLEQLLLYVTRS